MSTLSTFPLPLQPDGPPPGYDWEERAMSTLSTTTAFNTGIDERDTFLGECRCIVCGQRTVEHCHIIMDSEPKLWTNLKNRHWIPERAKAKPRHEPRDGVLLCPNHHSTFDKYDFFIRFLPDARKFILVNYSGHPDLVAYHGKAVALDIKDRHAPFPSIFIIHEMRVRGFHPFQPLNPDIPDISPWQDWIVLDGVFDNASTSFKRTPNPPNPSSHSATAQLQAQFQPTTMGPGDTLAGGRRVGLNAGVIADILAATRGMPSWKACEMEGTDWSGTAEENMQKYADIIGVSALQADV